MGGLQPWHLIIVALVFVVLFGGKKLPDAARGLGRSMRILKAELKPEDQQQETTTQAAAAPQPAPAPPAAQIPTTAATTTAQTQPVADHKPAGH